MSNHASKNVQPDSDDMLEHYQIDYSKARPNRFAEAIGPDSMMIVLDPDVAAVFPTAEAVNDTLRVIAAALQNVPRSSDIHYVANAK